MGAAITTNLDGLRGRSPGFFGSGNYGIALLGVLLVILLAATGCKKPKGPGCKGDGDCQDGKICRDNVCQMCKSNDDCGEGKTCDAGACKATECQADADCASGSCIDGTCKACTADSDCGAGGKCNSGKCQRGKACTSDEQCADDEDCVSGTCQRTWEQASTGEAASCTLATVYFAYDDDSIAATERDKLGENEQCLEKSVAKQVYLFGFTDDTGTDEYNIALSERRAAAVADYLSRLGIDPARMQVVPKGETEPTGNGADKDRRVEFTWK